MRFLKIKSKWVIWCITSILVFFNFVMAYSEEDTDTLTIYSKGEANRLEVEGSVLDSIFRDMSAYTYIGYEIVGNALLESMMQSFSPSFNTFLYLENGREIDLYEGTERYGYDVEDVSKSVSIAALHNTGKYIGVFLANFLGIFSLFMCLAGKSEHIKDSPLSIVSKYIFVLVGINLSYNIIVEVINFFEGIWTDFVFSGMLDSNISFAEDIATKFWDPDVSINTEKAQQAGALLYSMGGVIDVLNWMMPFLSIFVAWKFLKQVARLYIEIAERYFVMMLLILLLPAFLPTIISNSTKNIFSSYLRMFFCQIFLMLCNVAFMKIFFYILMVDGWTAGLLNYVFGLAFLRVCQRLDSYMMAMGLNVAQTGGGLLGAGIGAMHAVGSMIRGLGGLDKMRQNIGKGMMKQSLNTGNFTRFRTAEKLATPLCNLVTKTGATTSAASFSQQLATTTQRQVSTPNKGFTSLTQNTKAGFDNAAKAMGLNPKALEEPFSKKNIKYDDISSIKQLNDKATSFGFYDKDGNCVGNIDEKGNIRGYGMREDDLTAIKRDEALLEGRTPADVKNIEDVAGGSFLSKSTPLVDNDTILKTTGTDAIGANEYNSTSPHRVSYGTDNVTCIKTERGNDGAMHSRASTYEIKSAGAFPEIINDDRYIKVTGTNGEMCGIKRKETTPKNKNKYKKNPVEDLKINNQGRRTQKRM